MSFGDKLRAELDRLLPRFKSKADSPAGAKQRLGYLRGVKTGVTDRRLAQLLGVTPRTLHRWTSGERVPSPASRRKIDEVYTTFLRINNRGRIERLLTGKKPDKIHFTGGQGQDRYISVSRRQWRTFVTQWSHGDASGMTDTWTGHLSELSTPEAWWDDPDTVEIVA